MIGSKNSWRPWNGMSVCFTPRKQTSASYAADCDVIACYGGAKPTDKHLASKIHCVDDQIYRLAEAPWATEAQPSRVAQVPELTAIADIKLNARHSLRRCKERLRWSHPDISRMPSRSRRSNIFSPTPYLKRLRFHV
jgi:hypothetical protein